MGQARVYTDEQLTARDERDAFVDLQLPRCMAHAWRLGAQAFSGLLITGTTENDRRVAFVEQRLCHQAPLVFKPVFLRARREWAQCDQLGRLPPTVQKILDLLCSFEVNREIELKVAVFCPQLTSEVAILGTDPWIIVS